MQCESNVSPCASTALRSMFGVMCSMEPSYTEDGGSAAARPAPDRGAEMGRTPHLGSRSPLPNPESIVADGPRDHALGNQRNPDREGQSGLSRLPNPESIINGSEVYKGIYEDLQNRP